MYSFIKQRYAASSHTAQVTSTSSRRQKKKKSTSSLRSNIKQIHSSSHCEMQPNLCESCWRIFGESSVISHFKRFSANLIHQATRWLIRIKLHKTQFTAVYKIVLLPLKHLSSTNYESPPSFDGHYFINCSRGDTWIFVHCFSRVSSIKLRRKS